MPIKCSWIIGLWLGLLLMGSAQLTAQTLPPCGDRPTVLGLPWVDNSRWCVERVYFDDSVGEMAFTALAAAPDGTLYVARPYAGEIYALTDSDADGLPDQPQRVASGLTLPNGLAYYAGALYISGGPNLYRFQDDVVETLVDDLPYGPGFWTGGLDIGPDERLYVGIGAPCDYCVPGEDRSLLLSFALDGTDRQIVAKGLRQPSAVAWHLNALWTVDTARDGLGDSPNLDELNRVEPGVHFGWPYCIGAENQPDWPGVDFACENATPPVLALPTHSTPLAMVSYPGDALAELQDTLIIALGGAYNSVYLQGYMVIAVRFDAQDQPLDYQVLVPSVNPNSHVRAFQTQTINYYKFGLWPHKPYGLAVSPEGWLYLSVGGGKIYALRPPQAQ